MFLYFHLLAAPWVHQDQWYLHGTEACRAQGPSKALSFKCANFSSDCYWKVFDGRLLPNTRSEGSNAAGSIRTALAAFWKFTSGVVHLMATRLNLHCWLQDWATHRWGDLGQLEAPGMPQGRPMDHKGLDPTRNWWLAFKEKTKKTKRKEQGPGRGRLNRWSLAKWPWKTLPTNGQLWHWRHEDSTLSTEATVMFYMVLHEHVWKCFLFGLQCRAYTLWVLRYCTALETSSMKWNLQLTGKKLSLWGLVAHGTGKWELIGNILEADHWREILETVVIELFFGKAYM